MIRNRSASNYLEFLLASTVLGCLLAILIPVTFKVYEVSEHARFTRLMKEIDAKQSLGQTKNNNL